MNSISQNFQIEFKNYIKNRINCLANDIADDLISHFFDYSNDKYLKIVSTLEEKVKELVIEIFKDAISFFDDKYRNSDERKLNYHINIRYDYRTIKTIFGDITISRTYYESKDRTTHFYFIDTILGLDKYKRYDPIFKSLVIDLAFNTNQKLAGELIGKVISTTDENLTDKFSNNQVPRQTVNKWINDWHIPNIDYPSIDIESNTLYVMADEKWIHEQIRLNTLTDEDKNKKHYIMSKCFVCFSGITQNGNRRILNDRMVFITSLDSPWNCFLDFVTKVYDFEKLENIVFLSDAGKWLTSGYYDLKMYPHNKVTFCLCEFHARQKINRITSNQDYRNELNKCIDDNNKKGFKKQMIIIKEEKKDNEKRLKKLEEYENYIIKNWNKIQNMFKSECRSSMESHISHCVASFFSSRPKAFSKTNIENKLKLIEAKLNGIDIQKLYLKSYNNTETVQIKKEELDFSIFESPSSSNIPIIEAGKNNCLFRTLINLAHDVS